MLLIKHAHLIMDEHTELFDVDIYIENGKIVKATCDEDDEKLNEIFDTDEGARYVGEFSLGFNPKILYPMGDILYDEKILGSLHFTPGRCYADCDNGYVTYAMTKSTNDAGQNVIHYELVIDKDLIAQASGEVWIEIGPNNTAWSDATTLTNWAYIKVTENGFAS